MKRRIRLIVLVCFAALAAVPAAGAASRMWIGFHDDPSFRWEADRATMINRARSTNATMFRAVVTWADVAKTKPANPANPFDPAYRLNDVDELVRSAQAHGMEVLLTIWGTPKWANGGKGPAFLPRRLSDLTTFSRALATRYSGRFSGYPFVRFFSVWNESNLRLFLAPQYNAKGKPVGPANYAKLYAAAYSGIKAGNPRAQVGIGETSSHGREKPLAGNADTLSPGTFARLVAQANPRLKFDAWAHHPYPFPVNLKPTQKVRWPNVSLASLPRFEKSLDSWFKRRNVQIWITEYGHETKPGEPKGVTNAQQASYAAQALAIAKNDPRVSMFVWFVFQDTTTSSWQSGLFTLRGAAKPALSRFRAAAKGADARNAVVNVRGGTRPTVSVSVREFGTVDKTGSPIGVTYRLVSGRKTVLVAQPRTTFGIDGWIRFRVDSPIAKGKTYSLLVEANDANGVVVRRTLTLRGL